MASLFYSGAPHILLQFCSNPLVVWSANGDCSVLPRPIPRLILLYGDTYRWGRYLLYRRIRISKIRSDQDSEQINSDLSGNIYSKENRLSKITLYRSYQDSEQINSDLSGNICSNSQIFPSGWNTSHLWQQYWPPVFLKRLQNY